MAGWCACYTTDRTAEGLPACQLAASWLSGLPSDILASPHLRLASHASPLHMSSLSLPT